MLFLFWSQPWTIMCPYWPQGTWYDKLVFTDSLYEKNWFKNSFITVWSWEDFEQSLKKSLKSFAFGNELCELFFNIDPACR